MQQWNLIVDVALCENCSNCVLANKDEFVGNEFPGYSAGHALHGAGTLSLDRRVRGSGHLVDTAYLVKLCQHCDEAPCLKAGGPDVVRKRPDGIVIIDPIRAKGRRDLVEACPYGAIVWNNEQELPQQWIFDAHLLDQGWQEPRCAQSCPTAAITAVKTDAADMQARVKRDDLRVLRPELGTRPRVYYRNLHRYDACFVGGTVVSEQAGVRDCIEGAEAQLWYQGRELARTRTDAFGDFKFEALAPDSGTYEVRVTHVLGVTTARATLGQSLNLGELVLQVSAS